MAKCMGDRVGRPFFVAYTFVDDTSVAPKGYGTTGELDRPSSSVQMTLTPRALRMAACICLVPGHAIERSVEPALLLLNCADGQTGEKLLLQSEKEQQYRHRR